MRLCESTREEWWWGTARKEEERGRGRQSTGKGAVFPWHCVCLSVPSILRGAHVWRGLECRCPGLGGGHQRGIVRVTGGCLSGTRGGMVCESVRGACRVLACAYSAHRRCVCGWLWGRGPGQGLQRRRTCVGVSSPSICICEMGVIELRGAARVEGGSAGSVALSCDGQNVLVAPRGISDLHWLPSWVTAPGTGDVGSRGQASAVAPAPAYARVCA